MATIHHTTDHARTILIRWYELGKCHRIEQVFYDHPEFAQAVVDYYNDPKNYDTEYPTKLDVANHLLNSSVEGFADAIIALDTEKAYGPRVRAGAAGGWGAVR